MTTQNTMKAKMKRMNMNANKKGSLRCVSCLNTYCTIPEINTCGYSRKNGTLKSDTHNTKNRPITLVIR